MKNANAKQKKIALILEIVCDGTNGFAKNGKVSERAHNSSKKKDKREDSPMEENNILETAIKVFGKSAQEDIAIEEMSELTTAIMHNRRGRESNIPEEIADVLIAVEQLIMIHDCREEVNGIKYHKMMRLQERIFDECL